MSWHRFNAATGVLSIEVQVQPGARATGISVHGGDCLKVRVTARAIDGRANEAVCAYLAQRLGIAKSSVSIRRGASARRKTIEAVVSAFDPDTLISPADSLPR